MSSKTKITVKQIAGIVADYQNALPEWQVIGGDMLGRVRGPVGQVIWFDRLRTGAYRPTCRIHVLAAPGEAGGTAVLPQFLGNKTKEITVDSHARMLPEVLRALKSEIVPSISKPLDPENVAVLLGFRAAGRPVNAFALACLWAALGKNIEAARWIAVYHNELQALGLPEQPADRSRASFLQNVADWIKESDCMERMDGIVAQERSKFLGLD